MSSITAKTTPGDDLRAGHKDEKHTESTANRNENASPPECAQSTTVEQANIRFLTAIVDNWNERETTSFIQDFTPIMKDYLSVAESHGSG